jgi:hypothetical protein
MKAPATRPHWLSLAVRRSVTYGSWKALTVEPEEPAMTVAIQPHHKAGDAATADPLDVLEHRGNRSVFHRARRQQAGAGLRLLRG